MGVCATNASYVHNGDMMKYADNRERLSAKEPDTVSSAYLCSTSITDTREFYVNLSDTESIIPVANKERLSTTEPDTVRSHGFVSITTTDSGKAQFCISLSEIESKVSSSDSFPSTDSFEPLTLFSFDGLNKRVSNRLYLGLEIIKAKIDNGANPKDMTTHGDRTCLMLAVLANDYRLTKKLVKLGADVNKKSQFGETALGFATEFKRPKIAKYLRSEGAVEEVSTVSHVGSKKYSRKDVDYDKRSEN
jgi:hypothetical protein